MPTSHRITVKPAPGGRKYEYVCSCGARGWQTNSHQQSRQLGEQHAANARKGRR